jgi:hypothetical protein
VKTYILKTLALTEFKFDFEKGRGRVADYLPPIANTSKTPYLSLVS